MTAAGQQASFAPPGRWVVDARHSSVEFSVGFMDVATVRGRFDELAGAVEVDASGWTRAVGYVGAASIDTNEPRRDLHLRSPDFLDADAHPRLEFSLSFVEPLDAGRFRVFGEARVKGVAHDVVLVATPSGGGLDAWGHERTAVRLEAEVSNAELGVWSRLLDPDGPLVGDRVRLEVELSLVRHADEPR